MTEAQVLYGIAVSHRVTGAVESVVSELVTNVFKYAPGPCRLDLEIHDGAVEISVWDTDPALPAARAADPGRVGQHGLEIVIALCLSFEIGREPVGKRVTVLLADDPGGNSPRDVIAGHRTGHHMTSRRASHSAIDPCGPPRPHGQGHVTVTRCAGRVRLANRAAQPDGSWLMVWLSSPPETASAGVDSPAPASWRCLLLAPLEVRLPG